MITKPFIKVSTEKPPVWDDLVKNFGVEWGTPIKSVIVAYGDTLHCSEEPTDDVVQHELIHLEQQGYTQEGAKKWYIRYIADPEFRLDQELQAYRAQFQFVKSYSKDRNALNRYLNRLATDLASPMYGHLIAQWKARKLIREEI